MKQKLDKLLNNSHSTYSDVKVSSIAIATDGTEYNGVNVENASFGATMCAERTAMFSAISSGVKPGQIKSIHLTSSLDKPLFPCASCLQVMTELMPSDGEVNIYYKDEVTTKTLKELLPFAVTKESFEWK